MMTERPVRTDKKQNDMRYAVLFPEHMHSEEIITRVENLAMERQASVWRCLSGVIKRSIRSQVNDLGTHKDSRVVDSAVAFMILDTVMSKNER